MKIRIGSRGSDLALTQSNMVKSALESAHAELEIEIITIKTLGDKKQGTAAAQNGDKKDWILELEKAVVRGDIDLAIHSGKDVPCDLEPETEVTSLLPRATPFDIFIGQKKEDGSPLSFSELSDNAVIGTASLRRQGQLLMHNSGFHVVPHRGNVPTRVRKLYENKELSGIILAAAGVERLKLEDIQYELLTPPTLLPALNQGTLAAQFHSDRNDIKELLKPLIDADTELTFQAEREAIHLLEGDCKSAIAAFAVCEKDQLTLHVRVLTPNGEKVLEKKETGPKQEPKELGKSVGQALLDQGAAAIIAESRTL